MCALTLVAQILFDIQIQGMIRGPFAQVAGKHLVVQGNLAAGVFSFDVIDCYFNYFSTITIEPLWPGTDPLITKRLCSGSTFIT